MFEIQLNVNQSNQRFDKVLSKYLKNAPKSFIYKMLRKKNITLNGEKAIGSEKTVAGDTVQFFLSRETYDLMRGEAENVPEKTASFPEIPILYEDNDVCIFIKPVGVLSQKAKDSDYSVNEWIIENGIEKGLISASDFEAFRPSVCNRLDRNTGGIMTAGMSVHGLQVLSEMFREKYAEKHYYALVKGSLTKKTELKGYLLKNEATNRVSVFQTEIKGASPIHTIFTPILNLSDRTLLDVTLLTGKSHQIRAHLSSIGHPILGDPKYGDLRCNMKYGLFTQCLFAYKLIFPECDIPGISGKTFETEVPVGWPLGTRGG